MPPACWAPTCKRSGRRTKSSQLRRATQISVTPHKCVRWWHIQSLIGSCSPPPIRTVMCSEGNPELAFAINGQGTENVAQVAREFGARIFYISTDYVFDGKSTRPDELADPIAPLNVYGASKAAGEKARQSHASDSCIARTSWLFGAAGPSFPERLLRAAETRPELSVVADQTGSPQCLPETCPTSFATWYGKTPAASSTSPTRALAPGANSQRRFCAKPDAQASVSLPLPRNRLLAWRSAQPIRFYHLPAFWFTGSGLRSWQKATTAYLRDFRDCGKLR